MKKRCLLKVSDEMYLSFMRKSAGSKLGSKSIIAVVLLISIISITMTMFFITSQKRFLMEELQKRALSLSSNMAYNSQLSVLSRDINTLLILLSGVKKESDIEEAFITDINGVILAHNDTTRIGQKIIIETKSDSTLQKNWVPTKEKNIWRALTLIEIERKPSDVDEGLLFSPQEIRKGTVPDSNPVVYRQKLGYAVLDISMESMDRALTTGTYNSIIITLVMILVGALVVIYLVRSIANPIRHLADVTRAVAKGDLEQSVPITRSDEIGVLANSFNHMIQQLKVSREKIESWNRELELKVAERTRELKEKHHELEKAYEELKTLDKTKDDFLSLVSHELRTPLSSILLYSEMLLDGLADSEEDYTGFLSTIVENCQRLTRLINDVLDLSKIEAGRMPFNLGKLNMKELVVETLSSIRPTLESKGLNFNYKQVTDDIYILGDRDKIIQVLTNITSNAIKFTPPGGTISVSIKNYNENMGIIAVKDTGKGIKKEDIPKVFDRFSQLESIDYHSEGTGLGMTISKSIIERLEGNIWIESELGRGTTVFFTLPKNKPSLESNGGKGNS